MKPLLLLLISGLFLACEKEIILPALGNSQGKIPEEKEILREINAHSVALSGTSPTLPQAELAVFDYLSQARVVGLGEATHGTHEFFSLKDRLFRYLVQTHGFRAVIFEMDFAEALVFDDYVRNGKGPPDALMREYMHLWFWQNEEVRKLLVWMRDYNAGRPAPEQIRFLGSDAQTPRYNAAALIRRLRPLDAAMAQRVASLTVGYRQLQRGAFAGRDARSRPALRDDLLAVKRLLLVRAPELIARSSAAEHALLVQLSNNMLATEALLYAEQQTPFVNPRDLQLAANVEWWTEHLGPVAKTVFWGHNLHVADHPVLLNSGAAGSYLKDRYGDAYQSIGFTFATGSFLAKGPGQSVPGVQTVRAAPPRNAFASYFRRVGADVFVLKADELAPGSPADRLLRQSLGTPTIGASFSADGAGAGLAALPLRPTFDALIHVDHTTAARPLR